MKLIVGLGNPGKKYEKTRHNVGFLSLDFLAKNQFVEFSKTKFNGLYAETSINGEKVMFLKPQLYMNLSGVVVKKFVDFFNIKLNDILVINDDLDLSIGQIKVRQKGSSGGHNGLKDIEKELGSKDYARIKIGISKCDEIETSDYVLGKFSLEEQTIINSKLPTIENIIIDFASMDIDKIMNKYN